MSRLSNAMWCSYLGAVCSCFLALTPATEALAQACDDDAGALVCDDAGSDDDAGSTPVGLQDAGRAADGGQGVACSCTSDYNSGNEGRVHLCTGAYAADACSSLACTDGTFRGEPCSSDNVRLCCQMPSRDMYSELYADCTHPNCLTGFRAQCEDFGGAITAGACVVPDGTWSGAHDLEDNLEDDDEGGFCSVRAVRAGDPSSGLWSLWSLVALAALVRRRARRPR